MGNRSLPYRVEYIVYPPTRVSAGSTECVAPVTVASLSHLAVMRGPKHHIGFYLAGASTNHPQQEQLAKPLVGTLWDVWPTGTLCALAIL